MEVKVEQIQCGQNRPYGDFFRKWKIETKEKDISKIKQYCFENLYKKELPEKHEYLKNIRHDGKESGNADYYFAGYYSLENAPYGYLFTVAEPFCD